VHGLPGTGTVSAATITLTSGKSRIHPGSQALPNSQSQKRIWILGTVIAIVVLAAGGWFAFLREDSYAFKGAELAGEPAVDLALTDQQGEPFSLESQRGKVVVVYFGYTYCPDFCPTTMLDMMQVSDALGEDAGKFQLVMVSVDPARDTPERLDEYLEFYDPGFIGLTDTTGADALRDIQRGYGVMSAQQDSPEGSDGYLVDHSTSLFGIDPEGNLVLTWQYGAEPADIAADIEHLLND
jgi:protein SCO1/2